MLSCLLFLTVENRMRYLMRRFQHVFCSWLIFVTVGFTVRYVRMCLFGNKIGIAYNIKKSASVVVCAFFLLFSVYYAWVFIYYTFNIIFVFISWVLIHYLRFYLLFCDMIYWGELGEITQYNYKIVFSLVTPCPKVLEYNYSICNFLL